MLRSSLKLIVALLAVIVVAYGSPVVAQTAGGDQTTQANPQPDPPALRFDQAKYATDGCVRVSLTDPSRANAGSVRVQAYSKLSLGDFPVTLYETGAGTGRFENQGCIPFAVPDPETGSNDMPTGETLGVLLTSGNKEPQALDIAWVAGGKASGAFQADVDPSILPPGLESTPGPGATTLPLAMVIGPGNVPAFFGEDQVLYRAPRPSDLQSFVQRRGAQVISTMKIPTGEPKESGNSEAEFTLLRVDPSTFDAADMPFFMERSGVQGTFRYSSERARRLIGMIVEEQMSGNPVTPHGLMQGQAAPVSNEGGRDVFTTQWFGAPDETDRIRAKQAVSMMETWDYNRPIDQVQTAIVDGGFAGPNRYGGVNPPDYGKPWADITQCSATVTGLDCGPGVAEGTNPLPCSGTVGCDWHGTEMFSVAGAEFNNGFGGAGVGAHVVDPMFYKVAFPYIGPAAFAIAHAAAGGAEVINVSSGFPCRPLVVDICEPFQNLLVSLPFVGLCALIAIFIPPLAALPCGVLLLLLTIPAQAAAMDVATRAAETLGTVVVAAAGNAISIPEIDFRAGPFPPDEVRLIPCTLNQVVCAGEIDPAAAPPPPARAGLVPSAGSGFGPAVDVWSPAQGIAIMPLPDGTTMSNSGTSSATAFTSGVLSLIRAINPALTPAAARTTLSQSRCNSASPARADGSTCVRSQSDVVDAQGYVDVLDAVQRARQSASLEALTWCTGGWDEVATPADNAGTAIPVPPMTGTEGFEVLIRGDKSIHALPSDQDWYRFRPPVMGGRLSTEMSVIATVPSIADGSVRMEIHQAPFGATTVPVLVGTGAVLAGELRFDAPLMSDRDYLVRLFATAGVDNCYGGNTLKFRVVRPGPPADTYDGAPGNNTLANRTALAFYRWQHTHYDHRVLENRSTTPETMEAWRFRIDDLSLHTAEDRDFYQIRIPDPASSEGEGHPHDIRPTDPPRDPAPERMPECGTVIRSSPFPAHISEPDRVTFTAYLTVRIIPTAGTAPGEAITLHNTPVVASSGPALQKEIACPRTSGLGNFVFAFGERTGPRIPLNYSMEVEYKIQIQRLVRPSQWLLAQRETRGMGAAGGSSCPGGFFPRCPRTPGGPAAFQRQHSLPGPGCQADGPGCWDYSSFSRSSSGRFAMSIKSTSNMSFTLFGANMTQIARSVRQIPMAPSAPGSLDAEEPPADYLSILEVADLPPGVYVLGVDGDAGFYEATFEPQAEGPDTDGDGMLDAFDLCLNEAEDADAFDDFDGCVDPDDDADGVLDVDDNCRLVVNPGQENFDGDSEGDACDLDDDEDALLDEDEARLGTDPLDPDTDDDGVKDGMEVLHYRSDPLDPDTDGDLFGDGTEARGGSDPTNPFSVPTPAGPLTILRSSPVDELPVTDDLQPLF